MKTLYKIGTFLILALGIVHVSVTPFLFKGLTESALWFVSGGLVMVFISFFNFILMKSASAERSVRLLCHIANVVGLIFASTMFAINSLRAFPPVQSWLVLFLFIFEMIAAFRYRSQ
jgi:hypothetical protein